jgi:hypothetical protein
VDQSRSLPVVTENLIGGAELVDLGLNHPGSIIRVMDTDEIRRPQPEGQGSWRRGTPLLTPYYSWAFIFLLQFCLLNPTVHASDRLDPGLLRTVVRIETPPNAKGEIEIGSGFLFSTATDGSGKTFLITNKHMIGDWNPVDRNIGTFHPWINVFFYRTGDPSGVNFRASKIELLNPTMLLDTTTVHLHPSESVDIVAIDVTVTVSNKKIEHIRSTAYSRSYFVRFDKIRDFLTDIGDQVFALGYPLGISSLRDDYPIAKVGYLAAVPGQEVSIPFKMDNRAGKSVRSIIEGKFLIVDGLIVPGNSGGPVLLVGGVRTHQDPVTNQLEFTNKPLENDVIGVVSLGLGGGLTVVVSSDYVLDLIDSLGK